MRVFRLALRIVAILVVLVFLAGFIYASLIEPTREVRAKSETLHAALTGARSITLVEFSPYYFDEKTDRVIRQEVLLKSVTAPPEQVGRLLSATAGTVVFNPTLSVSIAGCYDPHHRVDIVCRDGSAFRFEVCLECRKFRFNHQSEENLPEPWLPRLRQFFTDAGMVPPTDGDYVAQASERMNPVTPQLRR